MSTGRPALIEKAFAKKQSPVSKAKPTKKEVRKTDKAIDSLQEGLTGKKVTEENKLSDGAKLAFIGLIPTLLGGLLGGEEGLGIGAEAAIKGVSTFQKGKKDEAALALKQETEEEKIAVQREAIESKEKIAGIQRSMKLIGLKQASDTDILKRSVPGVGTALNEKDSQILKEKQIILSNVTDGIDRLTVIGKRNLSSLSPEQRVAAQTEVQALIGQLRIPLTGPGPLTDSEREFMEDLIGNPSKFFALSSNEQVKLDTIKNKFVSDFENERKTRTVEGLQQSKIQEELKRRGLL